MCETDGAYNTAASDVHLPPVGDPKILSLFDMEDPLAALKGAQQLIFHVAESGVAPREGALAAIASIIRDAHDSLHEIWSLLLAERRRAMTPASNCAAATATPIAARDG